MKTPPLHEVLASLPPGTKITGTVPPGPESEKLMYGHRGHWESGDIVGRQYLEPLAGLSVYDTLERTLQSARDILLHES